MAVNPGAIVDKGGNRMAIAYVKDSWALTTLSAGTNCISLYPISTSSFAMNTAKTEFKSEAGNVEKTDFEYGTTLTATLMVTDKATVDFLAETVKGKFFILYKYNGIVDSKKQEVFAVGQVTPQVTISRPGGATSCPFEFTVVHPATTATFNSTHLAAIEVALSITIYATGAAITSSQGWVIKETA